MQETTKVYIADCDALRDPALFERLYRRMPAYRQEKIQRTRFDKDKRLSLGVGSLLCCALPDYASQPVTSAENGKPTLPDCPQQFNLSHSGSIAMLAVSPLPVGCDTEQLLPGRLRVAKRFFFAEEYETIMAQPTEAARDRMFCRLWTLKESFMKVTGLGMQLPLDSFRIRFDGDTVRVFQQVDDADYAFREYDCGLPYGFAVCTRGNAGFEEMRRIELQTI